MKRLAALAVFGALLGCTQSGELITGKFCSDVSYVRHGNEIKIDATCAAPYAIPQLPVSPTTLMGVP